MFQDDLQQEYKQENSRTWDYLANLDENMEKEYANKDLETNLKKMNSNTSPEYFA
jgi:hypothetical protein